MPQKSRKAATRLQRPKAPNNKNLTFTQREVQRVIKAARAMGVPIGKIEVDPATGKIAITPAKAQTDTSANEWDEDHGNTPAAAR